MKGKKFDTGDEENVQKICVELRDFLAFANF